jgi:hypothetical protein
MVDCRRLTQQTEPDHYESEIEDSVIETSQLDFHVVQSPPHPELYVPELTTTVVPFRERPSRESLRPAEDLERVSTAHFMNVPLDIRLCNVGRNDNLFRHKVDYLNSGSNSTHQ